jgi:transposase-like protein
VLYHLIKKHRGKEEVVMTDQFKLVNDRKRQLLSSQRKGVKGQRVEYIVLEAKEGEEKKPWVPHDIYLSGRHRKHPRVPKE